MDNGGERKELILQFFEYKHLPAHLQTISKLFFDLSEQVVALLPAGAERTTALRKLLEAKDCAVRSKISNPTASL